MKTLTNPELLQAVNHAEAECRAVEARSSENVLAVFEADLSQRLAPLNKLYEVLLDLVDAHAAERG